MRITYSGILRFILVLGTFLFSITNALGQLTVTGGLNANDLAQILAGPGITVSNATLNGSAQACGSFNGTASNIGMNSGIILCTGPITVAPGPNNAAGAGVDNGQPGNSQLNGLAGANTFNAFVLEFDFIPLSNTAEFNYVFGSEEYPEYVGGGFNDAFAFFISGPGIAGQQNIALIPGTGTPVTIDNVNAGSFSQYYVNNAGGGSVQYDAFTTVLTATSVVQACETYHLKIMIADAGDGVWDSGVFLEEGSLTSAVVEITTTTATADSTAYENCSNATVTFTLSETISTDYVVNYNVTGTATNGTDFPLIPLSVTIPANTLSTSFLIEPVFDGTVEGVETVIIDVQTSVCGSDTILIYINDVSPVTLEAFGDTAFCGGTAMLWASAQGGAGGHTYAWSNGMTTDTIFVSPTSTTTYSVTSNDFCASTVPEPSEDVTVTIDPTPVADAGSDIPYCAGDAVTLTGTGGDNYDWYQLPGSAFLGNMNPAILNPVGDVDYQMVAWIGSCSDTDFVSITELPASPADAIGDTSICEGQSAQLDVVGAVNSTFSWYPVVGLSNPLIQDPVAMPNASTIYTVTVTSISGCVKTDSVEILIDPIPVIDFSVPAVCLNEQSEFVNLTSISTGSVQSYTWNFGDNTSSSDVSPTHVYTPDGTYDVQLLAISNQGCADSITIQTTINPLPTADFNFTNDCEDKQIVFTDASFVSSDQITEWNWDFGNTNTSDLQTPPTQGYPSDGFYDVQLNVSTVFGCEDSITQAIEVYPVPIAAFTFDSVCLGLTNQFTDLSSPNGAYAIDSWDWVFSDTQTAIDENPTITFNQHGLYSATLTVTNTVGCLNTISLGNAVVHPLPVSAFDNALKNCLEDTTWFADLSTVPVQLNDVITDWNWNFGDASTSINQNTYHIYNADGFHPVSLITVTDKGCTDTVVHSVEIFPLPVVSFTSDVTEGCQPLRVLFSETCSIPAPYAITQWTWDLGYGNGEIINENPMNIYHNDSLGDLNIANYTVSLQATSANGCISSDTVVNYITEYPKPDALFAATPYVTNVLESEIEFTDKSSENVTEWDWEFGDGTYGTNQHPAHRYEEVGEYDVTQYVTTQYGCMDTISASAKIEPIYTFYIPNAFTPNSDDHNQEFFGQGEGISSYSMYIYDRWGELIFTSHDEDYKWDGTYNGQQVQQGTYAYRFYIIDWRNDDHSYHGHVTLTR